MLNIITLDQNKVVGIKQVKLGYQLQSNEIEADSYDDSLMMKLYNSETGEFSVDPQDAIDDAYSWRNGELNRTDALMSLSDYPYVTELTAYRQALRDWPSTEDFPETRPELGI